MPLVFNLIIPGTGLILRQREYLGFLLALLFGLCANIAVAGAHIAPAAIPRWIVVLALVLTIIVWIVAQIIFVRQSSLLQRHQAGIGITGTCRGEAHEVQKFSAPDQAHT